jgi:hypothetical protein
MERSHNRSWRTHMYGHCDSRGLAALESAASERLLVHNTCRSSPEQSTRFSNKEERVKMKGHKEPHF